MRITLRSEVSNITRLGVILTFAGMILCFLIPVSSFVLGGTWGLGAGLTTGSLLEIEIGKKK